MSSRVETSRSAPEVTVVIPTRNRWPMLAVALRSALEQQDVVVEVVVVDDGSSDETPARLARIEDARVSVLQDGAGRGPARARNAGITVARGGWISFLDDDDLWSPQKLRMQLDAVVDDDASFCYSSAFAVDERLDVLDTWRVPPPHELLRGLLMTNVVPGIASSLLARTELVRELGGFDDELVPLEDWDLAIRLAAAAARGAVRTEPLVAYRVHRGNSATRTRDSFTSMRRLIRKHRGLSVEYGLKFDFVQFTRWVTEERHRTGTTSDVARAYVRAAVTSRNARDVLGILRLAVQDQMNKIRHERSAPRPAPQDAEWLARYRRRLVRDGP